MPRIVQLPTAPNTGLGTLSQVLLGSATEYANTRRGDEREARRRTERLADVESDRAYEDRIHGRRRTEQLGDVESNRRYTEEQQTVAMRRELVRLGYLALGDLKNEEAVAKAVASAQRDGIADRYKEALATGDLTWDAIISGDRAKIDAGLTAFSGRLAERTKFQTELPGQAKERAGQLVGERQQLMQRASALEHRLSEPEPQPNPQQVAQRAYQLAKATKKPGQEPSVAEIQQAAGQAAQEITGQLAMQWNQQRQDALVQRSLLNDRLRDVSAEINTLTNRFGVVGVQPAGAPAAPTSGGGGAARPGKPDLSSAQKTFADQVAAELEKRRPKATPSPASRLTDTSAKYPATSVLGLLERAPSAAEFAMAPYNIAAVPGRALDAVGRYGGAALNGLFTGNYTVPEQGPIERLGVGIGEAIAGPLRPDLGNQSIGLSTRDAEDRILRDDPNSPMAYEIRRRRGIAPVNRLRDATSATPPPAGSASQWWSDYQ